MLTKRSALPICVVTAVVILLSALRCGHPNTENKSANPENDSKGNKKSGRLNLDGSPPTPAPNTPVKADMDLSQYLGTDVNSAIPWFDVDVLKTATGQTYDTLSFTILCGDPDSPLPNANASVNSLQCGPFNIASNLTAAVGVPDNSDVLATQSKLSPALKPIGQYSGIQTYVNSTVGRFGVTWNYKVNQPGSITTNDLKGELALLLQMSGSSRSKVIQFRFEHALPPSIAMPSSLLSVKEQYGDLLFSFKVKADRDTIRDAFATIGAQGYFKAIDGQNYTWTFINERTSDVPPIEPITSDSSGKFDSTDHYDLVIHSRNFHITRAGVPRVTFGELADPGDGSVNLSCTALGPGFSSVDITKDYALEIMDNIGPSPCTDPICAKCGR